MPKHSCIFLFSYYSSSVWYSTGLSFFLFFYSCLWAEMLICFQFSLLFQTLMGLQTYKVYPALYVNCLYSHPLCILTSLAVVKTKPSETIFLEPPFIFQTITIGSMGRSAFRHMTSFILDLSLSWIIATSLIPVKCFWRDCPFPHHTQRTSHLRLCVSLSWLSSHAHFSFMQEMNGQWFPILLTVSLLGFV